MERYVVTVVIPVEHVEALYKVAEKLGSTIETLIESAFQELLIYTILLNLGGRRRTRRI